MTTETRTADELLEILRDGTEVDRALARAVRRAIREHKEEGLPLAVWRDGRVVWVSAEELEAEIEEAESPAGAAES